VARSRPALRRASRLSAATALAATLVATSAAAAHSVYVSVNAGGRILASRPTRIHLLSNENLSALSWRSWGGRVAQGTGTDHGNYPSPGHQATNPVRVRATDRRRCGTKLIYTTIELHFTRGVPYAGQPRDTKYAYGCPS
jgi:hypothetical protein